MATNPYRNDRLGLQPEVPTTKQNAYGNLHPEYEVQPYLINPYESRPDSITQRFAESISGSDPRIFNQASRQLRGSYLRGREDIADQAGAAGARAMSQLAAHGGIGRGARERLQSRIGRQGLIEQNRYRGGFLDQIGQLADREASRSREGMLALAGLDEKGAQFNAEAMRRAHEFNVANRLQQNTMERGLELDRWKFNQSILAGRELADRQEDLAEQQRRYSQSRYSAK